MIYPQINKFCVDKPEKWKMRILSQIHTADAVGMVRQSCQYTIFGYCVQARLSAHTNWISCMYLAQYSPHLPFCVLIYILDLSLGGFMYVL